MYNIYTYICTIYIYIYVQYIYAYIYIHCRMEVSTNDVEVELKAPGGLSLIKLALKVASGKRLHMENLHLYPPVN